MPTIFTNENNTNTLKVIISSKFAKKKFEIKSIQPADNLNDVRRLPYIDLEESSWISPNSNSYLTSVNAVSAYLFQHKHDSSIDQVLEWESTVLLPTVLNTFSGKPTADKEKLRECLQYITSLLQNRRFLISEQISVADVVVFSSLYGMYTDEESRKFLSDEKLNVWIQNLLQDSFVQASLKEYPIMSSTYKVLSGSIPSHAIADTEHLKTKVELASSGDSSSNSSPTHQVDVLTAKELTIAKESWFSSQELKAKPAVYPVVPVSGERNILVTSALPYVNNVPHLGNIIGCVLSADVFARFCRLCNYNTLYISGTDEYGTATENKALQENVTPQQICDKYFQLHNDIYRWFGIGFDYFGRTSTTEQTEICQEMFLKLNSNGFISSQTVQQLFCPKCERFLADRFVEGGCPHPGCNYEDARGDQCDGCSKLVNAVELKNPRCKQCSSTPHVRPSEQLFVDLPKIEPMVKLWMQGVYDGWSHNAKVIGNSWIKEGLKPRCITRDLKWGVPVPLEKYKNKVFYVWFDAPFGYLSISKKYSPTTWKQWWCVDKKSKTEVELFQFMAKDNVPFHSIMFPATLLAINEGHTMVKHLMATEYLNYEDGKFSKSRGVGVFGNDARDTGIPADVWRFYLLYIRPESQDSSFSWVDLATKNNSELLNNLGNFANRALVFCEKRFNCIIPEMEITEEDVTLLALCNRELKGYVTCLGKAVMRDGIRHILAISRHGNQYMQANQPWVLLKGSEQEQKRAGTVIGLCTNLTCLLAILLQPYMPETSRILKSQLNAPDSIFVLSTQLPTIRKLLPSGHKIGQPEPLFKKIEQAQLDELKAKYGGTQEETKITNGVVNVKELEAKIAKQGEKVRQLKSSGADKSIWLPEVQILTDLKAQLPQSTPPAKPQSKKTASKVQAPQSIKVEVKSENLQELETKIAEQGEKVRQLKSSGVEKSVWFPEVQKLLELKNQLVAAGGSVAAPSQSKKTSPKVEAAASKNSVPVKVEVKSQNLQEIESKLAEQSEKVRALKASGADKTVWFPEVQKLLGIKSELIAAGGSVPAPPTSSKSKKK